MYNMYYNNIPNWPSFRVPHKMITLSVLKLFHWTKVIAYTPKRLDGSHHVDAPQIGKKIAGAGSFGRTVREGGRERGARMVRIELRYRSKRGMQGNYNMSGRRRLVCVSVL